MTGSAPRKISRCQHPSPVRRLIARFSFLPLGAVDVIADLGALVAKVANTIRFERFWRERVQGDQAVVLVPSFTRARTKHPIWDIAIERIKAVGRPGTILEFGMHHGGSVLYFWRHLPESMRLVGFDCFEGLPERWDSVPRGALKGYGAPVELWSDDPEERERVIASAKAGKGFPLPPQPNIEIESGLFSESVPRYLCRASLDDILLIHFDADLYISTRPVLDTLCGQMRHRYYLLFDEFYSVNHEFRAWMEFVDAFHIHDWRVVASSEDGVQVLIEVTP